MIDKLEVNFTAVVSEYDNCVCDACHGEAKVTKINMPTTLYHDREKLTTKYREYWLCDDCKSKLIGALNTTEAQI